MTYQKVTGTLNPGAHPGSYNGQDAYNDMLITGENNEQRGGLVHGIGTGQRWNRSGGGVRV